MKQIIHFYDKLFLYYYNLKKNSDDTPQYFPIIIISSTQAVNLFFLFILISFISGTKPLPEVFIVLDLGMIMFNFYVYQIRERKKIVLQKKLRLTLFFKIASYFYVLASLVAPLLLYYLINEYLT